MPRKDAGLWKSGSLRPVRSWLTERGKVHADDSMARFVRGRCHICTRAGEPSDIRVYRRCLTAPTKSLQFGHGERKSAMMIELPEKLEAALKVQANAHGVSPAGYVCEVLQRREIDAFGIRFQSIKARRSGDRRQDHSQVAVIPLHSSLCHTTRTEVGCSVPCCCHQRRPG